MLSFGPTSLSVVEPCCSKYFEFWREDSVTLSLASSQALGVQVDTQDEVVVDC